MVVLYLAGVPKRSLLVSLKMWFGGDFAVAAESAAVGAVVRPVGAVVEALRLLSRIHLVVAEAEAASAVKAQYLSGGTLRRQKRWADFQARGHPEMLVRSTRLAI